MPCERRLFGQSTSRHGLKLGDFLSLLCNVDMPCHQFRRTLAVFCLKCRKDLAVLLAAVSCCLWGAEHIRGELLKLGIHVAKSTIQKYLRTTPLPRRAGRTGQSWATFPRNHAGDIWAADFLPVTDLLFRSLHAFFIVEVASRRIMHAGVTRHPIDM